MASEKVRLIPWDAENEQHYQRMYHQRIACGYRSDEIEQWKEKQLKGIKFMYWVVLQDSLPNKEELIADHIAKYPVEKEPLTDTLTAVGGLQRDATGEKFHPVGHIALQHCPDYIERFSLPSSTILIASLFISWSVQSGGFGRAAMAETERTATLAPHNATTILIDTTRKDVQLSERFQYLMYDLKGLLRPAKIVTNQDWYVRQGYEVIHADDNEFYPWKVEQTGELFEMKTVWLKKPIAQGGV